MALSIGSLSLDLCKTISITPISGDIQAQGAAQGAEWGLVAVDQAHGKLAMRLVPKQSSFRGAWELTTAGAGRTLPVYFLPWRPKRIVSLPIGNDVPLFATAAITGCSVFTTGTEQSPTIYHAGVESGDLAGYDGDDPEINRAASSGKSELFWRLLLTKRLVPNAMEASGWSEVSKSMYINDGSGETARARAAVTAIVASHRNDKIVWNANVRGLAWGSYLGFCKGGKWRMYLQENLTFFYSHKDTRKQYATSLPIALTQVFPRGKERTNLINPAPTRIVDPFTPSDHVVEGWS